MTPEILSALVRENVAVGAAILAILALRGAVRRLFGSRAAYALWLAVPIALFAAVAPPRSVVVTDGQAAVRTVHWNDGAGPAGAPFERSTPAGRRTVIGNDSLLLAVWLLGAAVSTCFLCASAGSRMRSVRSVGTVRAGRGWLGRPTHARRSSA